MSTIKKHVYIVTNVDFNYDDEIYSTQQERDGSPAKVYLNHKQALDACEEANIQSFKDALFKLEPGQTATGETRQAYVLAKVLDVEESEGSSEEQYKEAYERLKLEKGNIIFKEWMEQAKADADILIDKALL